MSDVILNLPPRRRLLSPRRWRLWVIIADVLIMAGIFAIQRWPMLKLKDVVVDGPVAWQEVAKSLVTVAPDSNLLSIDHNALERRLSQEFGARAECRTRLELPGQVCIRLIPSSLALWTEGGAGISVNGVLIADPMAGNDAPIWRVPPGMNSREYRGYAIEAAAAWAGVLNGDSRWRSVISEWSCDPERGWEMTAADGKTKILLGWNNLESRAYAAARLLTEADTILTKPCTIDARFDQRLVVQARADGEGLL